MALARIRVKESEMAVAVKGCFGFFFPLFFWLDVPYAVTHIYLTEALLAIGAPLLLLMRSSFLFFSPMLCLKKKNTKEETVVLKKKEW